MKRRLFILSMAALGALGLSSCGDKEKIWKSEDKVKVVATTTMIQDMVRVIGGDDVEVYPMMKEGIDPHSYDETARDTGAMKSADLIFYSGLHLEAKMEDGLKNLGKEGKAYAVTSKMKESELIAPQDETEKYNDPHVWGDPVLWTKAIDVVVEGLSKKDSANAAKYKERGEKYRKELLKVNEWAKTRLAELPQESRVLVTSHDAFGYYARAFGFKVKALDGFAPESQTSMKKVEELTSFIKDNNIKMIFSESATNNKNLQALAKNSGVALSKKKLFADATGKQGEMEEVNGEKYDLGTYVGMIKHNVNAIVEGLK